MLGKPLVITKDFHFFEKDKRQDVRSALKRILPSTRQFSNAIRI